MENLDIEKLKQFCKGKYPANLSPIHGVEHWQRVENFGKQLHLQTVNSDIDVIRAFAYLHDSQRNTDGRDIAHGQRAARLVTEIRNTILKPFSDYQIELLKGACLMHTLVKKTDNNTINVCFDADRLDLPRVGVIPDPHKMATDYGTQFTKSILENMTLRRDRKYIIAILEAGKRIFCYPFNDKDLISGALMKHSTYETRRTDFLFIADNYQMSIEALAHSFRRAYQAGFTPNMSYNDILREKKLFGKLKDYLMSDEEKEEFNKLPDVITLYRGTSEAEYLNFKRKSGIISPSWTTNLTEAKIFAAVSYTGIDNSPRIVLSITISKDKISAYFRKNGGLKFVEAVYYHSPEDGAIQIISTENRTKGNDLWQKGITILSKRENQTTWEATEEAQRVGIWPDNAPLNDMVLVL